MQFLWAINLKMVKVVTFCYVYFTILRKWEKIVYINLNKQVNILKTCYRNVLSNLLTFVLSLVIWNPIFIINYASL